MTVEVSKATRQRMVESIQRYFDENMEEPIGDLKATLLLDFVLKEIGPSVYNAAIADAQAYMQERVADLDGACHEPEFGYWKR